MKKTQPIDWDKSYFDENILSGETYCYIWEIYNNKEYRFTLDNDFIAAFDEMLEEEIKKNVQARRLCYSWDSKTGWNFDSKKLRKPLKSIFKTTHETK